MVEISNGMQLEIDRGPNWLFVKVRPTPERTDRASKIADDVWSIVSRHFTYRVVLELDELESLPTGLTGQLKILQQRLAKHEGSLKICGLSGPCQESWHDCHLDDSLPNHASRVAAVLGSELATPNKVVSQ